MYRFNLLAAVFTIALSGAALAQVGKTEGEIRKVDPETGKITMKHGPVTGELDMPAMTMVFQTKDAHLPHQVQPGDKIEAVILKENGVFYIRSAEKK